jgi:hypothetical protein
MFLDDEDPVYLAKKAAAANACDDTECKDDSHGHSHGAAAAGAGEGETTSTSTSTTTSTSTSTYPPALEPIIINHGHCLLVETNMLCGLIGTGHGHGHGGEPEPKARKKKHDLTGVSSVGILCEVGRCRLTISQPVLKAHVVSALSA